GPEPITATRFPVRCSGLSGWIQPSSNARSMMLFSICLMVTGGSLIPSTHAAPVHQVVPVRNNVGQRTAGVAERNAAIHAAPALRADLFFGEVEIDLE